LATGTTAPNSVTRPGPDNVNGAFNTINDPNRTNQGSSSTNTAPGTNAAGTASSSRSPSSGSNSGTTGPSGSTTVGRAGNPAGGVANGRIDGTVTSGPRMQGDDVIKSESSQDSAVDKKIKSICKGC